MKVSKKQWLRSGVALVMLTGLWSMPSVVSAAEFTTPMSVTKGDNPDYVDAGVMEKDGVYHFKEDTTIRIKSENGKGKVKNGTEFTELAEEEADNSYTETKVTADKNLNFELRNESDYTSSAIEASSKKGVVIEAKKLNIKAISTNGRITGIAVGGAGGTNKDNPYKLTIKGDVDMNVQGKGFTLGLYSAGNADILIDGNVSAMGDSDHPWGIYSKKGETSYYGSSLIYSGNGYGELQMGPKIKITGDIRAKLHGNGIHANGGHAKITVDGGGYIEVDEENKMGYYAIVAESATASMNVKVNDRYEPMEANQNDLIIKGNIAVTGGAVHPNEPETRAVVNLGLATKNSQWTGMAQNAFGEKGKVVGGRTFTGVINVFLQNGATWNHLQWGRLGVSEGVEESRVTNLYGGAGEDKAGVIYQTNEKSLTVDNYRGYTTVFYAHGDKIDKVTHGYEMTGKSIKIKHAEAGSGITLLTGNENLDITSTKQEDKNLIIATLNNLAGKLFYLGYKDGETNLTGKVGIAEGLTTSSASREITIMDKHYQIKDGYLKKMTFKKENNGQGQYIYDPHEKPPTPSKPTEQDDTTLFKQALTGVERNDTEFVNHGVRQTDGTYRFIKDSTLMGSESDGLPVSLQADTKIDAAGHTLTLTSKTNNIAAGLNTGYGKKTNVNVTAKKLVIHAESLGGDKSYAYGIYGAGPTMLRVKGMTEIVADGEKGSYGIFGDYNEAPAKMMLDGLTVSVNKNGTRASAIRMQGQAEVFVNVDEGGNVGKNVVKIDGDIYTMRDDYSSKAHVALTTKDSYWHGLSSNVSRYPGVHGVTDIWLSHGATWVNEKYGNNYDAGFKGSHVTNFVGGTSQDTTGFIIQKDEEYIKKNQMDEVVISAGPITIDHYSGYTTIFYNHSATDKDSAGKGLKIIGGDTKITEAKEGSVITLLTGNEGLDTNSDKATDKNLVSGTLNALANKLFYTNHGDKKLTGKVGIAEGLTSRSVVQTVTVGDKKYKVPTDLKDISWKDNGQGEYKYTEEVDTPPKPSEQDDTTIFRGPITGNKGKEYMEHGVQKDDLSYHFTKKSEIKTGMGKPGIDVKNQVNIVAPEGLSISVEGQDSADARTTTAGIFNQIAKDVSIEAKELDVSVTGKKGKVHGIDMANKDNSLSTMSVKGDLNVKVDNKGNGSANGILVSGNSKLEVTGKALIFVEKKSKKGAGAYNNGAGVQAKDGGQIVLQGDVDIQSKNNGVASSGQGASVRLSGGHIETAENAQGIQYAVMANKGGHVSINMNESDTEATDHKVEIVGNIGITSEGIKNQKVVSVVKVGLTGENSSWKGEGLLILPDNSESSHVRGELDVFLNKGAVWNHASYGMKATSDVAKYSHLTHFTGGDSFANAGYIIQNNEKEIHIDKYSGNAILFYQHKTDEKDSLGKGYAMIGGDMKISHAKEGSVITLLTGNEGLDTNSKKAVDKNLVSGTLNALANKLFYTDHTDGHLTGKVGIAEGLTSRSVVQTVTVGDKKYKVPTDLKDISWKDNGQGEYKYTEATDTPTPPPEDLTKKTEFTTQITGDKTTDALYEKAGILKEDGRYELNRDIHIKMNGAPGIAREKDITIQGHDQTLTVENKNTTNGNMQYGITSSSGRVSVDVKKLNIIVDNSEKKATAAIGIGAGTLGSSAEGHIFIKGDTTIKSVGTNMVFGIYAVGNQNVTIDGNLSMVGDTSDGWGIDNTVPATGTLGHYHSNGIFAGFNGAKVQVNGNINLAVKGTGLQANTNSEVIVTGGGTLRIAEDKGADQYALEAEAGTVKFHYEKEGDGLTEKDVTVKGNIGVLNKTTGASPNEDNAPTEVYLGLSTASSTWTGVAFNQFAEQGKDGGKIHLYLGNGATWNHETVGITHNDFKASHIYELVGNDKGGVIYQKAKNDIVVDTLSGKYTLFMAHKNKGTESADYEAGNIHVKEAKAGAEISLITDNSGNIDITKEDETYQILNTLAGKLYYEAAKAGKTNLVGKVGIAEGLTTTAKVLTRTDMKFKSENGQGFVEKKEKPNPNPGGEKPNPNPGGEKPNPNPGGEKPKADTQIETLMMNGGKNAMGLAATLWLSNNNDLQRRMGDIRLTKEETGLWARYQGGKNVWNPDRTKVNQTYSIIQVGFDRKLDGWTLGGALDYGTADDNYHISDPSELMDATGTGKEKQYSFALYGSKAFDDGTYVDVIMKAAKVNSRYTLNYTGKQMTGDYDTQGLSGSVEYGKRITNGGIYIEPSIELTMGHMGASDYTAQSTFATKTVKNQKMVIHQDAFNTLRGRLGLSAGYQTEESNAFVKLSFNKEFNGEIKATFQAEGEKDVHPTVLDLKDSWMEIEIGGSHRLDKDKYIYATLTKGFSAVVKTEWRLDAGIRLAF